MMLTNLLLAASLAGGPEVQWTAPSMLVAGKPYLVEVQISAPEEGAKLANWLLTPSAFTIGGKPIAKRDDDRTFQLPGGFTVSGSIDLSRHIREEGQFALGYAQEILDLEPVNVRVLKAAPEGLDFMEMPVEELSKYNVLISTVRGDMLCEVWPDKAPKHARNFLDLAYTGFYDGTIFHRVIPGFMIQGGDPTGTGTGDGPRQLEAEFNADVKHVAGTLSMARGNDVNSASCQFFVMHGDSPGLDGQYSAFGKLLLGADVVDAIVRTPRNRSDRPNKPQTMHSVTVVMAEGAE
jgi:cyclophilin family peptidyl-prolyl cis-trans isomerase